MTEVQYTNASRYEAYNGGKGVKTAYYYYNKKHNKNEITT